MKKENPLRNQPRSFGANENSLSRRGFLKRSGGATATVFLAWGMGSKDAKATENETGTGTSESTPELWGMLCVAPSTADSIFTDSDPVAGQSWVPVSSVSNPDWSIYQANLPLILSNADAVVRKVIDVEIVAGKTADPPGTEPYTGPVDLNFVAKVWSKWEVYSASAAYGGKYEFFAVSGPVEIERVAVATCDTVPGPKDISFYLDPNEKKEDTGQDGSKITTSFKVEPNAQEGLLSLEVTGSHRNGGQGDTEVMDTLFQKNPMSEE
ncbi:twin-arginine translocation signal domain-containing protein [Roseibacillus persicicus]|uniref:twin-arginine translocation signal domain-containing protein n=1 Tax=Roseibacillus persicicus TaxID=454148 RepID=UPI00280C8C93|nr:twin-arginine translocation signal domain-containing protein [Roseibacillus persicicus]MDQ8192641.1 twin-arginine translocation signal domain-containing protein [Roseibacillus persicicus]